MLILTRRVDEEIVIGHDIRVTVVSIQGNKVRLGISAPDSVGVVRSELLEQDARARGEPEPTAKS